MRYEYGTFAVTFTLPLSGVNSVTSFASNSLIRKRRSSPENM